MKSHSCGLKKYKLELQEIQTWEIQTWITFSQASIETSEYAFITYINYELYETLFYYTKTGMIFQRFTFTFMLTVVAHYWLTNLYYTCLLSIIQNFALIQFTKRKIYLSTQKHKHMFSKFNFWLSFYICINNRILHHDA